MPFCGRKFNGSGYIGSRWSSFLDLSHGRNIRLPHTHAHTHSTTHPPHPFKFVHHIYSTIETEGSGRGVFICQAPMVNIFLHFFLPSPRLLHAFIDSCVSHALPSSLSVFLAACFQDFHKPPGGSTGCWSCRLTNPPPEGWDVCLCVCVSVWMCEHLICTVCAYGE